MELLQGENLRDRLRIDPLTGAKSLGGIAVADGLAGGARKEIIHRDLKPETFCHQNGGVKILDFGLARRKTAPQSKAI